MLIAPDPAAGKASIPGARSEMRSEPCWEKLVASVAHAASMGVRVYPSVKRADFFITGNPQDAHLTVKLVFTPSVDNQRIEDEIRGELVPGLEAILGTPFSGTDLDYSVDVRAVADPLHRAA